MTPEEFTALFMEAGIHFPAILGKPTNNNFASFKDMLMPLLINLDCDMNGPHNIIGLVQNTTNHAGQWNAPFP